jgi:lipoprotein-anchoring transpeptidase ErfK/SrfK
MGKGLGRLLLPVSLAAVVLTATAAWAASASAPDQHRGDRSYYRPAATAVSVASPEPDGRETSLPQRAQTKPDPEPSARRSPRHLLASVEHEMRITARPGGGKVIGRMPLGSRFYGRRHKAWILDRSANGRYGKVTVPYSGSRATGWIRLAGMKLSRTPYSVRADLSRHSVAVKRGDKTVMRFPAATGASSTPTPPGRYFVTDRISIPQGGSFGTFAFGISGIQTHLPAGWSGGDQLAIHGTSSPSSIGTSASAGCLRVSETSLDRLKPLLQLGTPVVIKP